MTISWRKAQISSPSYMILSPSSNDISARNPLWRTEQAIQMLDSHETFFKEYVRNPSTWKLLNNTWPFLKAFVRYNLARCGYSAHSDAFDAEEKRARLKAMHTSQGTLSSNFTSTLYGEWMLNQLYTARNDPIWHSHLETIVSVDADAFCEQKLSLNWY